MKIENCHERLNSAWGVIDAQHNQLVASRLSGKRVLDVGCGYGSLVAYLRAQGFDAEGWDYDPESIRISDTLFPDGRVKLVSVDGELPAAPGTFDSIVLKDSLHHLAGEGDIEKGFANIRGLLKDGGRLVILDPNPTALVRFARKIVSHVDPEAPLDLAVRVLNKERFDIKSVDFYETIGLPLSGGYVGPRLVPNWQPINHLLAAANDRLSRAVTRLGVARSVCWRYVIAADKLP
jgi:SAM-dependent methyltransferase